MLIPFSGDSLPISEAVQRMPMLTKSTPQCCWWESHKRYSRVTIWTSVRWMTAIPKDSSPEYPFVYIVEEELMPLVELQTFVNPLLHLTTGTKGTKLVNGKWLRRLWYIPIKIYIQSALWFRYFLSYLSRNNQRNELYEINNTVELQFDDDRHVKPTDCQNSIIGSFSSNNIYYNVPFSFSICANIEDWE